MTRLFCDVFFSKNSHIIPIKSLFIFALCMPLIVSAADTSECGVAEEDCQKKAAIASQGVEDVAPVTQYPNANKSKKAGIPLAPVIVGASPSETE